MFLKHLSIYGFKSFAKRTEISFADGITALVGPNGCGKSNVVDAIKWVLGEQASKSLRAEKMEDVIFNGTESQKAINVAEVTLILANETGLLPLDMPEVEIKRRLHRSGESEYFINSKPSKLKEIRELFWDTGVGKAAYSVMEQGKIDQILSSKPDERRYLFEEAAGITRYKVMGAETERKLAKTSENMRQVELLLNEVKHSYDILKVQSEKTLKYRALKDEIFNYELDIQLLKLKQFKYERDGQNETLRRRTADRDSLREQMEAESKALEEHMDEMNSMEAMLVEMQKKIYGLALEKNARENEARIFSEQRNEGKIKIEQNEVRDKQVSYKIEELNSDASEQDEAARNLRQKAVNIDENIHSFEENIKLASTRISDNEKAVHKNEAEIHAFEKKQAEFEILLKQITDDIVAELDAGLKKAGYSVSERHNIEASLNETLGKLNTVLAGKKTLLGDLAAAAHSAAETAGPEAPSPIGAAELQRIAEGLAAELAGAASDAGKAIALFESYRSHMPAFIDEFLAPEGIITKKRSLDDQIKTTKEGIDERRKKIRELHSDNTSLAAKINEYRITLEGLRVNLARMIAQAKSAEEQAKLIRRELTGQESMLKTIRDELALDRKRLDEIDERISDTRAEIAEIEKNTAVLNKEQETLVKDIKKRSGDVAGKQAVIKKRTAELDRVQEALEKIHRELASSETEIKNIQDNFRENHSRDLMEFEERILTITAHPGELREKLSAASSIAKDLSRSINFMAPEEFAETKERYDFLNSQLTDLEKACRDLEALTAEIRTESSELFINTYNRIKKNFHKMFRRLFGGGTAELQLSDSNHVLESGIEILAQPPGKKLEHISLLSGGERSMTAVALLFATYMVKPSPFCLLDEIDAALDEANIGHFVHLLREFSDTSQFIIITHNKKTVAGASTLLGITMEESGITKLITVRVENGELSLADSEVPQHGLWDEGDNSENEIAFEAGCQLPPGVDDPSKVSEEQMRPIRGAHKEKLADDTTNN